MIQTQATVPQVEGGLYRPFTRRRAMYKLGFFLLFPSFLMYIYSFGSSSWFKSFTSSSYGLWRSCHSKSLECDISYNVLLTVRIISTICTAGYVATIVIGLVDNFRRLPANFHSRKVEWVALSTAGIGSLAIILFLVYFTHLSFVLLGSSFYSNVVALTLLFLAGGLMACGNQTIATTSGMMMTTIPPQQTTTTVIYYPGHHQPQPQISGYPAPLPHHQPGGPYNPAAYPNMASLPPAYGAYPNPSPASPPPPYMLPPAYPQQGGIHPHQSSYLPPPSGQFYDQQRQQQLEAGAPLLSDNKMKPGMY